MLYSLKMFLVWNQDLVRLLAREQHEFFSIKSINLQLHLKDVTNVRGIVGKTCKSENYSCEFMI